MYNQYLLEHLDTVCPGKYECIILYEVPHGEDEPEDGSVVRAPIGRKVKRSTVADMIRESTAGSPARITFLDNGNRDGKSNILSQTTDIDQLGVVPRITITFMPVVDTEGGASKREACDVSNTGPSDSPSGKRMKKNDTETGGRDQEGSPEVCAHCGAPREV
jgi:hypothetical protein